MFSALELETKGSISSRGCYIACKIIEIITYKNELKNLAIIIGNKIIPSIVQDQNSGTKRPIRIKYTKRVQSHCDGMKGKISHLSKCTNPMRRYARK